MGHEKFVRDFLVAPHSIACIHEEEIRDEHGITILYDNGTSYWRPFDFAEECEGVWETLLAMRPTMLAEFDDVLLNPENVREVAFIEGEHGEPILMISFKNHQLMNSLFFDGETYRNFEEATVELINFFSEYQHRRANVWFANETFH